MKGTVSIKSLKKQGASLGKGWPLLYSYIIKVQSSSNINQRMHLL